MSSRKKILILVEWFAPGFKAGGPIQSCVNLCIALKELYEVTVLTTDTDHGAATPYAGIEPDTWTTEKTTGVRVFYATQRSLDRDSILKMITEVSPDYLYLNLLFSPQFVLYPLWLKISNQIRMKLILCPRGTLYDSALSLRSYKKKPLLFLLRWTGWYHRFLFHATNAREKTAISRYFPGSDIVIADNLPRMIQPFFQACHKTAGILNCIFVGRIVPIKNLLFLLQLLHGVRNRVHLTIVGPAEDTPYWLRCKDEIELLPANVTVRYEGAKQNSELQNLLTAHHLFILPTTGENFGHAIFESLLAGRPVLISDQTPWLDIEEHQAGWAVALDDRTKFINLIDTLAEADQYVFDRYAQGAFNYANRFIHDPTLISQYKLLFS